MKKVLFLSLAILFLQVSGLSADSEGVLEACQYQCCGRYSTAPFSGLGPHDVHWSKPESCDLNYSVPLPNSYCCDVEPKDGCC
jgi:hypothetical protein